MNNWQYNGGSLYRLDSKEGRMFETDLHKVNELIDKGKLLPISPQENFLTKEEMLDMNELFKRYKV
jgi:hypothetical protein